MSERVNRQGELRVKVSGRPVSPNTPIDERRPFATRDELMSFIRRRKPDPTLRRDIRQILDETVDQL